MWQFLKQYFMPEYVSKLDQFLHDFDKMHAPSTSQSKVAEKYRRLHELRDFDKPAP